MRGRHHYARVLAGTALALLLATPFASTANDAHQGTAVPAAAPPAEQPAAAAIPAAAMPASMPPAASDGAVQAPTTATDQTVPDPLASLDPADRAVAERIRDR